jgi:hypothetical protein
MAVIGVNENKNWFTAAWSFEHVLKRVLTCLPESRSSFKKHLQQSLLNGSCFLNLESVSVEDLQVFEDALERVRSDYLVEGANSWQRPEFFQPFIESLDSLIRLCGEDPRSRRQSGQQP